jgi:hypothetical protein
VVEVVKLLCEVLLIARYCHVVVMPPLQRRHVTVNRPGAKPHYRQTTSTRPPSKSAGVSR